MVGERAHVGALEVGHSVVVDVRKACGRVLTGHRPRHGGVKEGHEGTLGCEKKDATEH